MLETSDLTIILYTANVIPTPFASKTYEQLLKAAQGQPIIVVSKIPMPIEEQNIVVESPRSHFNIYRQALIGARAATTKYIALAEDDALYSPEHFKQRSSAGVFAYNLGAWSVFTWGEPIYSHKGTVRKNLNSLICERELFIKAMEERFAKYPHDEANKDHWAEPGRYERHLGVTEYPTEEFYTNPPNIIFSHQSELSFAGLGTRKRVGEFRAYNIPYWGDINKVRSMYV